MNLDLFASLAGAAFFVMEDIGKIVVMLGKCGLASVPEMNPILMGLCQRQIGKTPCIQTKATKTKEPK